jgi:hypothetical protein
LSSVPHDQFDEWLVFSKPTEIQTGKPLVNYCGFSLTDPAYESFQEDLWCQIERVSPESYLADGDCLIFITSNPELHRLASGLKELD